MACLCAFFVLLLLLIFNISHSSFTRDCFKQARCWCCNHIKVNALRAGVKVIAENHTGTRFCFLKYKLSLVFYAVSFDCTLQDFFHCKYFMHEQKEKSHHDNEKVDKACWWKLVDALQWKRWRGKAFIASSAFLSASVGKEMEKRDFFSS